MGSVSDGQNTTPSPRFSLMHVPQTEVILKHDSVELAHVTVPPGDYVIGRSAEVEIHAETPLLSRRHAKLTVEYDQLFIQDLGSSNGTFVNDQPVKEITRLFPNQSIRLGPDITLEVRRHRPSSEPDLSLAPKQAAIRRHLPEELLTDKRYAIGSQIARGGMGAILDAKQTATKRTVAMKVMLGSADEGDVLRFIEEAQVTAQLDHPNIVPVYELGVDEQDQVFYTMKMVRGITLKKVLDLLAQGIPETVKKYPLPALLTIFQKVCDAVAFAHSRGVIHRDLKPENIMLGDFGSVLVMDWGLAKIVGRKDNGDPTAAISIVHSARVSESNMGSTMTGTVMGTPQYMSPEQARGEVEDLDARSDVYALGTILYQIVALRPPVIGRTAAEIVNKVAEGQVEALTAAKDRDLPGSLASVIRKAMAFERDQRYRSVEELQRDLTAYQNGFATRAEKAGIARQLLLALKRHKIATLGAAAVLLVGVTFGTKAVVEGQRAEREAVRANAALADLKKSAPALLQLAENEAGGQQFESARDKIDAALALDPALLRAWWQRAWVLLALERWSDAADALRLAGQHDPASAKLTSILPAVEKMGATASDTERWKSDAAREIFHHLQLVEANGPALAFGGKLTLSGVERSKLVEPRLVAALGKNPSHYASTGTGGLVEVNIMNRAVRSLEPIRGLPIDNLVAANTLIVDLEPLRGLRLQSLNLGSTKITDLAPLSGMPLRVLYLAVTPVADLTPLAGLPITELTIDTTLVSRIDALRGMPLTKLNAGRTSILDWSPLKGAPLVELDIGATNVRDLSFLEGMPLRTLNIGGTPVVNLAALRGLPLENLILGRTPVADLTPLQGTPLKFLDLYNCRQIKDFTPILTLSRLERLRCDVLPKELLPLRESKTLVSIEADGYPGENSRGERPVAEFWRAYDAHQAGAPK